MSAASIATPGPHLDHPQAEAARLYAEHRGAVFRYCLRRLRRREEADDAVQTTFVYALMSLRRGIVPEFERTWLFTIAGNVCSSRRRAAIRRGQLESPHDLEALKDVVGAPERLPGSIRADAFHSALESMPVSQRRAILLREWRGLSYREIGDELGLSEGATETLLFRARKSLARKLEDIQAGFALNAVSLLSSLRSLFAGAAAKTAAATAFVAVSVAGGPALERHVVRLFGEPTSHAIPVSETRHLGGAVAPLRATGSHSSPSTKRVARQPPPIRHAPVAQTQTTPAHTGRTGSELGSSTPAPSAPSQPPTPSSSDANTQSQDAIVSDVTGTAADPLAAPPLPALPTTPSLPAAPVPLPAQLPTLPSP